MNNELQLDPSNILLRGLTLSDYKYLKNFKCGNGSMELFLEAEATERHIRREASTTLVFYNERLELSFPSTSHPNSRTHSA